MTQPASRPVVRLKPKADARRIRWGAPWVSASDLVLDRRTKALAPGTIVTLEDADRSPLATAALTAGASLPLRILDRATDAEIDGVWMKARLQRAVDLRNRLYDTPFFRLVHGEADDLPGLIIDLFGETAVIQPNAAWLEPLLPDIVAALNDLSNVTICLKNASSRVRGQEGLDDVATVLSGSPPESPVPVVMNGATYFADLTGGQKTGLFFDQRPNHAFVAGLARDARVLDVFSHVGGFSLAALARGAASAIAIDGSAPALALATKGADATGVADRFETRQGDAFDMMAALTGDGETFDIVVCDPPAFAPSKASRDAGLRAYERVARMAAPLVRPGGVLTLCSCSHAADLKSFTQACVRGIGRGGRQGRLIHVGFAGPDHPVHPSLSDTGYLKSLVWRLD